MLKLVGESVRPEMLAVEPYLPVPADGQPTSVDMAFDERDDERIRL